MRVLVRNAETGRTGVESAALTVPPYDGTQPVLLPPIFLEAPGSWLLVRERAGENQQASVVYPFTVNGEPYVPAARPALSAADTARLCLVAYNLGKGQLDDLKVAGEVLGGRRPEPAGRRPGGARAHGDRHRGARQAGRDLPADRPQGGRLRAARGGDRCHGQPADQFRAVRRQLTAAATGPA